MLASEFVLGIYFLRCMKKKSARRNSSSYKQASAPTKPFVHKIVRKKPAVLKKIYATLALILSIGFLGRYVFVKVTEYQGASAFSVSNTRVISPFSQSTAVFAVTRSATFTQSEIEEISLYFLDFRNDKIVLTEISPETEIDVMGEVGVEKLKTIIRLAALKNKEPEAVLEFVQSSLTGALEFKVSGVVMANNESYPVFTDLFNTGSTSELLKRVSSGSFRKSFVSSISYVELLKVGKFVKSLPTSRLIQLDQTQFFTQPKQELYEDLSLNVDLLDENKSITILNGSDQPGYAGKVSQIVVNLGGRVIGIENASKKYDNGLIVSSSKDSMTVLTLRSTLGIDVVLTADEAIKKGIIEKSFDRSDVIVILGFDTYQRL